MATIEPVEIELLVHNAELPDPELVLARFAEHYAESVERARDLAARAEMDREQEALFGPDDGDDELLDITELAAEGDSGDDVGAFFAAQAEGDGEAAEVPELGDAVTELDAMLAAAEEMPDLGALGSGDLAAADVPEGATEEGEEAPPVWDAAPTAEPAEDAGEELAPEDAWSADQWAAEPQEAEAPAAASEAQADEAESEWSADQWAVEPEEAAAEADDAVGEAVGDTHGGGEGDGFGFDAPEAAESTPPIAGADDAEGDDEFASFGAQGPLDGGGAEEGFGFDEPEAAESTPPVAGPDDAQVHEDGGFGAQGPLEAGGAPAEDAGWSADLWDAEPDDEQR